jgi:DNA invertase Pin-like site-specific DNA recombinase/transposase
MPRPKNLSKPKLQPGYVPPSKRKPKAAIYVRVSTHYQVDRDSLPFQRQELENYSRHVLNITDWEIFEDAGYSAKNTDRPKYQEMMARIRKGEFTHLLVWKLDRISRNLRDFTELWDELKEYGVTFVSKMEQFDTSTAMGEAMLRIILVFAELERKLTAERVYSIMLSRAQKALWNGAPVALGYDWDPENETIKINPEEAELVHLIFDLYEEKQSALAVAEWLHENGKKTKRGGTWGSKSVIDILRNPIYIGVYRWNYRQSGRGELKPEDEVITVENALPAIISREQWERVQKLLDGNYKGRRDQQRRAKHLHILSGLIRCGYCGKTYISARNTKPHKHNYHPSYYRCGTYIRNRQCRNKTVSGLYIEPFVLEYLRAYVKAARSATSPASFQTELLKAFGREEIEYIDLPIMDAGLTSILGGMAEAVSVQPRPIMNEKLESLKKQKQKIERALARLDDAYFFPEGHNAISKSEYLVKKAEFQQRLSKVDSEIAALASKYSSTMSVDIEMFSRFLLVHNLYTADNIRDVLPALDKQVVQDFLQQVISFIEVADGRVTKIAFNSPDGEVIHRFVYREMPS